MAIGIKVNLGSDIRYLPSNETQPAKAYVRLAQAQFETSGGEEHRTFKELPARWYDGVFTGAAADQLQANHQKGDALVVVGNVAEHAWKNAEGQEKIGERFYVSAFGPDATRYEGYTLQRRPRAAQAAPANNIAQQAAQTAAGELSADDAEAELFTRLNGLVQSGRISPDDATAVMGVFVDHKHEPAEVTHAAVLAAAESRFTRTEDLAYAASVTASRVSGEPLPDWNTIASRTQPAPPAPAEPAQTVSM